MEQLDEELVFSLAVVLRKEVTRFKLQSEDPSSSSWDRRSLLEELLLLLVDGGSEEGASELFSLWPVRNAMSKLRRFRTV